MTTDLRLPIHELDRDQANRFLNAIHSDVDGILELRFIRHRGESISTFDPKWERVEAEQRLGREVYFGVCPRKREGGTKADLLCLPAFWVDLDPRDWGGTKEEALARIRAFPLPPSIIVDSGNGIHGYWLLKEPEPVTPEYTVELEGYLRGLAEALGGDHVTDLSRVMRLPGTHNLKDLTNPKPCTILELHSERRYSLSDFCQWQTSDPTKKIAVAFSSEVSPPPPLESLRVSNAIRSLIVGGWVKAGPYKSRSEADAAVVSALVRGGHTEDEIRAVFLHPSWGIGAKYRERGRYGDTYLLHTIGKARTWAVSTNLSVSEKDSLKILKAPLDWPILAPEALYGLPGEIVRTIDPYTEADPVAVLANILTAFGNVVGAEPHFRVEFTRHHLRLFVGQVGVTAKGRKGVGWSAPRHMFAQVEPAWAQNRITSGLSSGEGLIFAVRDPRVEKQPIRKNGRVEEYQEVTVDHGVEDKRLLVVEEEFSQALKVMSREGNILSPIIRQAWDSGNLHPLTKQNPIKATGAHISIIGHITMEELLRHLNETEQANGFANRFIWLLVKRSKMIPNPTGVPGEVLTPLVSRVSKALAFAQTVAEMKRDAEAEKLWAEVYPALSEGKPGLIGAILARAEAQAMRLACIFALLNCSEAVRPDHLKAALAVWDYAEASARRIFGGRTGSPTADRILGALQAGPGLDETEIHNLFGRHKSAAEIRQALDLLHRLGLASPQSQQTAGRPRIIWRSANYAN